MTDTSITSINRSFEREQTGLSDLDHALEAPPDWLTQALSVKRVEGVVNVNGCDIHYFRWGDAGKPGIVMLHGFLSHARCFAFVAPYLAQDYHVVAYDMSGMGDSGARQSYSDDTRVQELIDVTEHTGLIAHQQAPVIIAHSYGGSVATSAILAHPSKFSGLIICDLGILRPSVLRANASKFSSPGNQQADRRNRIYPDYATAKKRFVLAPPQRVGVPALFDFMAYHSLKQVEGGWQWKFDPSVFKGAQNRHEFWSKIGEKVVKTPGRKAIVYGQESSLFSDDSATYVRELINQYGQKSFPIIGIPHAAHHLMLDQPIAFVSTLLTVLETWEH